MAKPLTPEEVNTILYQETVFLNEKEFGVLTSMDIEYLALRDVAKDAMLAAFRMPPEEIRIRLE